MYNILKILSRSSPQSVHASVWSALCTSALLESAMRAAEDQAGWKPEPCPLWIRTLCQSIPHRGLNKLSPSPLPYNTMPLLVAYLPTML